MANTFKSYLTANVTSQTTVHTAPVATQTTIIGLSVANVSTGAASLTVILSRSGSNFHLIKDAPIPAADSLIVVGGDQKVVMQAGDILRVTSSVAVDVIVSVLEVS
jgi:hypothetical protein